MKINKFNFNLEKKSYIIAEIGINHEGSLNKALSLIKSAKKCGANAVKFQFFKASDLYLSKDKNFKIVKNFELSPSSLIKLRKYSKKNKIDFICTPFSLEGANLLKKIRVDAIKIASMDNNNYILIDHCLKYKKPIIVSTGMMNLKDLKKFFKIYKKNLHKFIILHCLSSYPTNKEDSNLVIIDFLRNFFKKKAVIGYSDHTLGLEASKIAITRGARVIEKHFTFDNTIKKYDHVHSMNNMELKELVNFSNVYSNILGSHAFLQKRGDEKNRKYFRRGFYAIKALSSGMKFNKSNTTFVRPANSEKIDIEKKLLKKRAKNNIKPWKQIKKNHF